MSPTLRAFESHQLNSTSLASHLSPLAASSLPSDGIVLPMLFTYDTSHVRSTSIMHSSFVPAG